MSTERDTGGPAFPVPAVYDHAREQVNSSSAYSGEGGMTLRDYLAAHASDFDVQSALEDLGRSGELVHCKTGMDRVAVARYACADAMLKARQA